jgi:hypothetical protein
VTEGTKEESVKLNNDPDEETTDGISVPNVLSKERAMSTNVKVPVVVIPAFSEAVTPRFVVKESVDCVLTAVDLTVVWVRLNRSPTSPDEMMWSVREAALFRCFTPTVTEVHG